MDFLFSLFGSVTGRISFSRGIKKSNGIKTKVHCFAVGNKGAGSIISPVTIEWIICTITKIECQDLLGTMSKTFHEFVILNEINLPFGV
jgi:hypothetical protein